MSKAIQFVILSFLLCLAGTVFAQVELTAITATTLTVTGGANSRECPQTNCKIVAKLKKGTIVTADATAVGTAVNKRNSVWYHIILADGRQAFVYSGTVSVAVVDTPVTVVTTGDPAAPAAPAAPVEVVAPSGSGNTVRPANCAQAREWGLTAEQAGQWSNLDRDHDGVACYGD